MRSLALRVPLLAFVAVFSVGGPAVPAASAKRACLAPPGNSAVDQYCEEIPSAGGSQAPGGGHGSGPAVARSTAKALAGGGKAGAAVLALAGGSPPTPATGTHRTTRRPHHHTSSTATTSTGPSTVRSIPTSDPLRAVSSSVQSGDTIGSGFIWILVASTALMAALGWLSFRRRDKS